MAQNYHLESHVISGGGETSSGGDHTISGTIGQAAAGFSSGGDYELRSGFWGGGLTVVVEPDESFETWMENLPDEAKPPEDQRGPNDTPGGDGMANLLKYALGLMPLTPSAEAAPTMVSEDGYLGIELERSRDAAVTFQLEGSEDFLEWVDVPFNAEIINPDVGDNRERINLISVLGTDTHSRYFLRLRVHMH